MLYAIVAALVIILDQWIKLYVSTPGVLPEGTTVSLIPGILNLTNVKNDGAAFGFLSGSNATVWFILIAGVFTVLVIIALATKFISGPLARWSIVLVTAGGVSNCIDRVINFDPGGYVQDMFQFDFAKTWFPVFNLADVFITVFCILFIIAILFGRSQKDEEDSEFEEDEEEELAEEEEEQLPKRGGRKARKAAVEEDEEEYELPVKANRSSRKARQARYDEEYEQYKAAQRARQEALAAEEPQPAATVENPSFDPADPFAEWERANAAQQPAAPKVELPAEPEPKPVPQRPAPDYSALAASPQFKAAQQPAQTAQPAAPKPAPVKPAAPKPAPAPVKEESFSLDDILAEFK